MADAKLRRVGVGFVCGVPAHPFGGREGDGRLISLLQIRGLAGLVAAIDKEPSMGATIADFTKERSTSTANASRSATVKGERGMSYEWEKGDPATEQCACMSGTCTGKLVKLHFDGWYLRTFVGETVDSAQHARSGLPVGDEFDYSAARQQAADAGPIPEGNYWIVPSDLGSPRAFSAGWGHYRITIRHYPNTATHGRGGFFVHGGSKFGSKGCIDLAGFMDTFVRRLNELVPAKVLNVPQRVVVKPTCYVPLVVKYSSPRADMPPWFNT